MTRFMSIVHRQEFPHYQQCSSTSHLMSSKNCIRYNSLPSIVRWSFFRHYL
uniref:Uncharacterized protein n=1 Tax=Anguilla anguilla TaxID=7936 RepID=A0A0E9WUG8_ANGAN